MRILLIAPALPNVRAARRGRPVGARIFRTPPLGLMMVAAATPAGHSVRILDEHVEPLPMDADADLVGISVNTCVAERAYTLARDFRSRGIPVVLGGFHVSFNPEEALRECDSIVTGEAEPVWPHVIQDVAEGRMKRRYEGRAFGPLRLPPARRDLVRGRGYYMENVIQATRGCPFRCAFCGVNQFYGGTFRTRPVAEVVDEIRGMRGFRFLFTDDHLTADREYAKALFKALIPLRRKWAGMTCLTVADDDDLLDLAARSGCVSLFLGFETVNPANLDQIGKAQNRVDEYRRIRNKLHTHGISVEAGTIFGLDEDTPEVFDASLAVFRELGFDMIQVAPLTPFPGCTLYEQYRREGRLLDTDRSKFDIQNVVYRPARMTPEELDRGLQHVRLGFYTLPSVLKRVWKALWYGGPVCAHLVLTLNLGYRRNHRAGIGYPP